MTEAIKAVRKFEAWARRPGGWTLDSIAECVHANDDISLSLTEAILAAISLARAYLAAAARIEKLEAAVRNLTTQLQKEDDAWYIVQDWPEVAEARAALGGSHEGGQSE